MSPFSERLLKVAAIRCQNDMSVGSLECLKSDSHVAMSINGKTNVVCRYSSNTEARRAAEGRKSSLSIESARRSSLPSNLGSGILTLAAACMISVFGRREKFDHDVLL